jgi:hypothetical protein
MNEMVSETEIHIDSIRLSSRHDGSGGKFVGPWSIGKDKRKAVGGRGQKVEILEPRCSARNPDDMAR